MKLNTFGGGFFTATVMSILLVWVFWGTATKMLTRKITNELTDQFQEAYHQFEETNPKIQLYKKLLAEREAEIIEAVDQVHFWQNRANTAEEAGNTLADRVEAFLLEDNDVANLSADTTRGE